MFVSLLVSGISKDCFVFCFCCCLCVICFLGCILFCFPGIELEICAALLLATVVLFTPWEFNLCDFCVIDFMSSVCVFILSKTVDVLFMIWHAFWSITVFKVLVDDDIDSKDSESVRSLAFMFLFKDVSQSLRLPKLLSTLSESPFTAARIDLVQSLS